MNHRTVSFLLVGSGLIALALALALPQRLGHPVTPYMKSTADGSRGIDVTSLPIATDRPTVVVFVLPDCPCSVAYEPILQRL